MARVSCFLGTNGWSSLSSWEEHFEFWWKNEKRKTILLTIFSGPLSIHKRYNLSCITILPNLNNSQNEQNWNISSNPKKCKKYKFMYYYNQQTSRVGLFLSTKHETNSWSSSSSREWHRIFGSHLGLCWRSWNKQKNYRANSLGPICILQLFKK